MGERPIDPSKFMFSFGLGDSKSVEFNKIKNFRDALIEEYGAAWSFREHSYGARTYIVGATGSLPKTVVVSMLAFSRGYFAGRKVGDHD